MGVGDEVMWAWETAGERVGWCQHGSRSQTHRQHRLITLHESCSRSISRDLHAVAVLINMTLRKQAPVPGRGGGSGANYGFDVKALATS